MALALRRYRLFADYERVNRLLRENFDRFGANGNIQQPRWEYAHSHPNFNHRMTHRFGLWEDDGELVGAAFYEMNLGEAFLACKKGWEGLKPEMAEYAERELCEVKDGKRVLIVYACDFEGELASRLAARGFEKAAAEATTVYEYADGFPDQRLPEGYRAISLEEENDMAKIHRALWRGFNHGDEPDDDLDCRLQMQSAPNFRKDLTTVIVAPDGEYACFAGMWLDGVNDFAYLEPLATVPEHRGKGLARAAVSIGMEKTQREGATYCFGGSVGFYGKIGFKTVHCLDVWKKVW